MYLRQDFRVTRKNRRQRQFREVASAQTYGTFLRRLLRLRPVDRLAPQKSQIQSRPPEPYSFPQLTTLTFLLEIGCYTIHGSSFRTFRDFRGWIINSKDVERTAKYTKDAKEVFTLVCLPLFLCIPFLLLRILPILLIVPYSPYFSIVTI